MLNIRRIRAGSRNKQTIGIPWGVTPLPSYYSLVHICRYKYAVRMISKFHSRWIVCPNDWRRGCKISWQRAEPLKIIPCQARKPAYLETTAFSSARTSQTWFDAEQFVMQYEWRVLSAAINRRGGPLLIVVSKDLSSLPSRLSSQFATVVALSYGLTPL